MFTKTRLPEYYFGDDINQDNKLEKSEFLSLGNNTCEDCYLSEPNISRIPSPTSSLASIKKLEWDSGADIGYNAYNSAKKTRRSKSFPTLNMDLSISQINKSDETQGDEISINKVTAVMTDMTDKINSSCLSTQATIKERQFQHSTPIEEKIAAKIEIKKIKSKDECLQTSVIESSSKSVQTDIFSSSNSDEILLKLEPLKSSMSAGSSLSKSSSFQYIPGSTRSSIKSAYKTPSSSNKSQSVSTCTSSKSSKNNCDDTSLTSPLAKMIATQQSQSLITDIDKSLNLLQKFISSENYTPDTKKFYARKIVNKIISSKYIGDSSTSNSSTSLSSKKSETPIEPKIQPKNIVKSPEKVNCAVQCDPIPVSKKSKRIKSEKIAKKLEEILVKSNKLTEETRRMSKPTKSDSEITKNWKSSETISEKLFEARKKSANKNEEPKIIESGKKTSYLIEHSKNERKRQLSWINNEISYLHRLKDLLQKTDTSSVTSVDDMKVTRGGRKSNLTISTNNINSSLSDIESRYKQEFGSSTINPPGNAKELEMALKISKFLSSKQIKTLLSEHCHCNCCKHKHNSHNDENKDQNSYDFHCNSFNSHSYKSSKKDSPKSTMKREDVSVVAKKSDMGTQCKLRSYTTTRRRSSMTYTLDSDYESDRRRNMEIFYQNSQNFYSLSNIFEVDEPDRMPGYIHAQEKSRVRNRKPKRLQKPVAYYLTFEEDSKMEIPKSERVLDNVTIKVPKSSVYTNRSDEGRRTCTLQDYLMTNRPDFIKAADWRKSMISDLSSRTGKKTRTIFTCYQMKEMTAKKYKNLPEVKSKIQLNKTSSQKRQNRFMQQMFAKRLQKKTLKGELCIATCVNVMDTE